jgi:hypothetical protein
MGGKSRKGRRVSRSLIQRLKAQKEVEMNPSQLTKDNKKTLPAVGGAAKSQRKGLLE